MPFPEKSLKKNKFESRF